MKFLSLFFLVASFSFAIGKDLSLSPEVEKVLKQHLNKAFGTPEYKLIGDLSAGGSGASLKIIAVNGKNYVLRTISTKRTKIQVQSEFVATEISSTLNIGPKIYFYDLAHRFLLTDYLTPLKGQTTDYPGRVVNDMSQYLSKLNQININSNDQSFRNVIKIFQSWNLDKCPKKIKKALEKILSKVLDSYELFQDFSPMLAHNDLHFGNILVGKERAYIIDWEEFYISNAPFELAATIYRVVADESLKESLMQKFYNRVPTKIDHAKFRVGSIIYLFMQAVKDLSTLDEKDRFGITYNEYKSLPEPTMYLKKILGKNEEITLETKKVYFWSMMKKVDSLVSERGFHDDFKLINKSEKREPKAFKRTVLERFKES